MSRAALRSSSQDMAKVSPLIRSREYHSGMGSMVKQGQYALPANQSTILGGTQVRVTKVLNNFSNAFNGAEFELQGQKVYPGDVKSVREAWIHMQVTTTTAGGLLARLIPAQYWIKKVEIRSNSGSGDRIQQFFSDTMWSNNNWHSSEEYRSIARTNHHTSVWSGSDEKLATTTTRDILLPLDFIFSRG